MEEEFDWRTNGCLDMVQYFLLNRCCGGRGIILYVVLHEIRKGNETLSRSAEALARGERITLATLERLATRQGTQA